MKFLWEGDLIRYERQETAGGLIQEEPLIVSLYGSDLTGANLSRMDFRLTNLWGAQLVDADLGGADGGAGLSAMQGTGEDLVRARMSGISFESTMRPVDAARLVRANLRDADLRGAQLMGVDLIWADLRGADLTSAKVTNAQLERVNHLEGATMPNGQEYEDWLKSKGRELDG